MADIRPDDQMCDCHDGVCEDRSTGLCRLHEAVKAANPTVSRPAKVARSSKTSNGWPCKSGHGFLLESCAHCQNLEIERLRNDMARAYMRLQCADVPRDPWHWEVCKMLDTSNLVVTGSAVEKEPSRSVQRRVAVMRGEPAPTFEKEASPAPHPQGRCKCLYCHQGFVTWGDCNVHERSCPKNPERPSVEKNNGVGGVDSDTRAGAVNLPVQESEAAGAIPAPLRPSSETDESCIHCLGKGTVWYRDPMRTENCRWCKGTGRLSSETGGSHG